jgi:hypothetical protein
VVQAPPKQPQQQQGQGAGQALLPANGVPLSAAVLLLHPRHQVQLPQQQQQQEEEEEGEWGLPAAAAQVVMNR